MREMVFACGIEGSEAKHLEAFETLVLDVLGQVAENGVEPEKLEAVLHQLELHQREISGDSYPYGLQLILTALGCATHYADPIAVLNLDPVLDKLREQIADPDYIKSLAQRLLLDNPHRVSLVLKPDRDLSAKKQQLEAERLQLIKAGLDEGEKQALVEQALALAERQTQEDDDGLLPKVELSDVPPTIPDLEFDESQAGGFHCSAYSQGTNGLVYQQTIAALPALDEAALEVLPYYTNMLTELGLGSDDYLRVQDRQSATCGSINAFTSMRGAVNDPQKCSAFLVLSSKALLRNQEQQAQLMRDTLEKVRFDELERIRELVSQQRARREQSVTGNGHGLAMAAASAGMSPVALINHQLSGLAGIRACKQLDDSLGDKAELERFAAALADIHGRALAMPHQFLAIGEAEHLSEVIETARDAWAGFAPKEGPTDPWQAQPVSEMRREIWAANTQVNFCAKAFPTVPVEHEDAAALTVLGGFLRNGYLHTAIREQGGAYGGGASQDSSIGAFRMYSYRDPRLEGTLDDFDTAIEWSIDRTCRYLGLSCPKPCGAQNTVSS